MVIRDANEIEMEGFRFNTEAAYKDKESEINFNRCSLIQMTPRGTEDGGYDT